MMDLSQNPATLFHILLSVLTVCILGIAGLLALLLSLQERLLRYKYKAAWVERLPSLETVETLLFKVNSSGFVLLTVVLMTSVYFYHALLWQQPLLLQKTLLALGVWVIFFILLLGRYWRGWRGQQAASVTLCGVVLLTIICGLI